MIQTKTKTKQAKLAVLTPKGSDKILKDMQGKGKVVETEGKHVTVEHPQKKFCIRFSAIEDEMPKLPTEATLEKIAMSDKYEEVTFRSKGGRVYKMQVGIIFFYPC